MKNSTILIVVAVTPIVVAPPLLSPFLSGRVHDGRDEAGIASLPSGPQFGEFFAAAVPTPASGRPPVVSAAATDGSASAVAISRTMTTSRRRCMRRGMVEALMRPPSDPSIALVDR